MGLKTNQICKVILILCASLGACGDNTTNVSGGDGSDNVIVGDSNTITDIDVVEGNEDLSPLEEACVSQCTARGNPAEGITDSDCFQECIEGLAMPAPVIISDEKEKK